MVAFTQHDLQFILDGILVSEEHARQTNGDAGGVWTVSDIETSRQILRSLVPNSLEPIGMRTISGELNNLELGQDQFGATGNEFPRLTPEVHSDDGSSGDGTGNLDDDAGVDLDGPLGPMDPILNTDYGVPGIVTDSDPRIISNLVVDQSVRNPAALEAAGVDSAAYNAATDDAGRAAELIAAGFADNLDGTWTNEETGAMLIDPDFGSGFDDALSGNEFFFLPNVAPDEGLSAPFNAWMTFFGQFFDHGLDFIPKQNNGTIFIPLADDDPLRVYGLDGIEGNGDEVPQSMAFIALTRAEQDLIGGQDPINLTSPFVDQNQTYTSHPSHQIFVRAYEENETGLTLVNQRGEDIPPDAPIATGALLEGAGGGMATWADVKAQASSLLGIELTDAEALDIPMFAVDQYGEFLRGPTSGLPQFVITVTNDADAGDVRQILIEGDRTDPVSVADALAAAEAEMLIQEPGLTFTASPNPTGFSFLLDIAHDANPADGRVADDDVGNLDPDGFGLVHSVATEEAYDNELLDAHFIAGDGRVNENFALTAVHHVFHQEHNRVVEHTKATLLAASNPEDIATVGDEDGSQASLDLINNYLRVDLTVAQQAQLEVLRNDPTTTEQDYLDFSETEGLVWHGDRLFQAAKFATEMQYQHLVFEEFGRKVQPLIDIFASFEPAIDASITMEFSQAVYRFGHSMLTENVDLIDADGNLTEVGLVQAFLNPLGFNPTVDENGNPTDLTVSLGDSAEVAGALARGLVRETGNAIDEHVTEALRNNLLGLPLDLAAINIARGRDVGLPKLQEVRETFFEGTGDTKLRPYESWVDFAFHTKNEWSVVNFIAAYGEHAVIAGAADSAEARANAFALVTGDITGTSLTAADIADRSAFLNGQGIYAADLGGLNNVDLWIGGLAEATEPFGGFLGSTFNFVFEEQMEDLQDGDRFYYLARTAGLNFLTQLEQNSFAGMIARNTDIEESGWHLPGDIFASMNYILEVDQTRQFNEGMDAVDIVVDTPVLEAGTVDVAQLDGDQWHTVTFSQDIENAVVAMMINTLNGTDPATVRVRNVTDSGFEFQIDEWDYLAPGGHVLETLSWVAATEGTHVLDDGTIIEAGTTDLTDETVSSVALTGGFTDPVVLTQVSTVNDPAAVTTRHTNVTATGFDVRLQEEEASATSGGAGPGDGVHATESVGWIAIQGTGGSSGIVTGTTGNVVTQVDTTVNYAALTDPVFLAQMLTTDGGDTATIRGDGIGATSSVIFVDEEQSEDAETAHTTENVGFLALNAGVITLPILTSFAGAEDPTDDGRLFSDLALVMRDDPSTAGPDAGYLRFTGGDHVVLGGTDPGNAQNPSGNDTLIGGIGDDTLWGGGGDDTLEGGDGADILLGGDGDDIITDVGGEDNIQGQDGNDYIFSGAGEDLILAGAGKDFVIGGPDLGETFGGLGDDFITAGSESNITFGGEGNDWLEGGTGNNLVQGDNGDPFLNSTVGGHDVFISGQGDDDYDTEGGDDIMEGADGVQRFEGVNGFDWATYKDVDLGVNADMLLRAFDDTPIPPSNASIMDRFDSVQGLSGGRGSDILRGDDEDRLIMETLNNGNDSVLRGSAPGTDPDDRFALIHGLREGDHAFVDASGVGGRHQTIFDSSTIEWGEGDIILGGAGSDLIEGRGGDDIIDGDLKLDVRLIIRNPDDHPTDPGIAIATAFRMEGQLYAVNADGDPVDGGGTVLNSNARDGLTEISLTHPLTGVSYSNLDDAVANRVVNPGDIHIHREIIDESGGVGFDTAEFSDVRDNYTISGPDADGFYTVSHDDPALGAGQGVDGVDRVRNVERLQFSDQTIELVAVGNTLATGGATIRVDATGAEAGPADIFVGQMLRADPSTIIDADGTDDSIFIHFWQFEEEPGSGVFVDFELFNGSGEAGPLEGAVIEVPPLAEGSALRVKTVFQDDDGVFETVFSDPTEVVAPIVSTTPTDGDDNINGTVAGETINALAGDDIINALAGDDTIIGGPGSDIIDGGADTDTAVFTGDVADFLFAPPEEATFDLEVVDTITGDEDLLVNVEFLQFDANSSGLFGGATTIAVADILAGQTIFGTPGADTLIGSEFNDLIDGRPITGGPDAGDVIEGEGGDDNIFGRGGADEIAGGAGDDFVRGNGGNDIISWRPGEGRDLINGGGNGGAGDTVDIRTNGDGARLTIYSVVDPDLPDPPNPPLPGALGPLRNGNTEIVITYDPGDGSGESIIAEIWNVEELVINAEALAAGVDPDGTEIVIVGNFDNTSLDVDTITINGSFNDDTVDLSQLTSDHRIVFNPGGGNDTIIGELRDQDVVNVAGGTTVTDNGDGTTSIDGPDIFRPAAFDLTASDLSELLNLVRGDPSDLAEDHATGIRDLEGTGNNESNPDFGSADQPFIRLTDARYGAYDAATGNRDVNPIFDGLEPREISNILGTQESDLPTNAEDANIFFMAFGQYLDHGLDFLPKGGNGTIFIDGEDVDGPPHLANFADLTRGSVDHLDGNDIPQHLNKTSPFVDQNQAYGSTELVGQFLREGDGNGGLGARLLAGAPDPSNTDYNLLPTLRELILHHWDNDTVFSDPVHLPTGPMSFRDYFTDLPYTNSDGLDKVGTLVNAAGEINEDMIPFINADFMGSGHTLVGDANPFVNLLDHYVAGDLRANENYALTSMHTIWARNHNFHVNNLEVAGFTGSAEEAFQAAKILNESEYQRVVFEEFADQLLGGLRGSGDHGHDDYNPAVDARISHEFAAAAYRFGHSLISQTFTVIDENGVARQVPLTDAFLNPTNDDDALNLPLPPGYSPEDGYEQLGINGIIEGIAGQPAEEVDHNVVDAVRDDLVRVRADLFSFNVARGWDVGLGTLNQVRADLMKSNDPYVMEAIELSGEDLNPYESWQDFASRNGLSAAILAQFMAAYPDLELQTPQEIADFMEANPDIELTGAGNNIVRGIDRLDFWVGGLAEEHIRGGMVGTTFWVVLHEQFDRLQEGDRFYYLDRVEDFDFYEQVEDQTFADIVARNTGLEGLSEDIFMTDADRDDDTDGDDDGDGDGDDNDDDTGDDDTDGNDDDSGDGDGDDSGSGDGSATTSTPQTVIGDDANNTLIGGSGDDMIAGNGADDNLLAGGGNDTAAGGDGNDNLIGGAGDDVLIGNAGDDTIVGNDGNDFILGGDGMDQIMAGSGDDWIDADADRDVVDAGSGNDTVVAGFADGDDVYRGGDGIDTYDMAAVTSDAVVDLGLGMATSSQSGADTISDFENVITGAGNDTIIASSSTNVMTGGAGNDTFVFNTVAAANNTHITDFAPGDTIDLSGIADNYNFGGDGNFDLLGDGASFSQAGQLIVRADGDDLVVEGNVDGDSEADFAIRVSGKPDLDPSDFNGV